MVNKSPIIVLLLERTRTGLITSACCWKSSVAVQLEISADQYASMQGAEPVSKCKEAMPVPKCKEAMPVPKCSEAMPVPKCKEAARIAVKITAGKSTVCLYCFESQSHHCPNMEDQHKAFGFDLQLAFF